ncbi:MAG: hypothetical protein KZQ70_00405 [gamma proteobacterium symbiont of Lucinoma myriamae]|nr:hypothetical protein [gamma proteobacterium symbiont of Lucinoma myriamae]MCU7817493.1 hypothetical protein [gamma proteobacterium symbiont of Lucinoma myriamae]MCU7831070.1 hypothetical protein [gamma proteobacterium symbiont of Lucinoma myriamae]
MKNITNTQYYQFLRGKPAYNKQQGVVLFISLIFLLILTILGVSATKSTILEEKMAGNMRDYSLAFQAAEVAVRDGEKFAESLVSVGDFKCIEDLSNCVSGKPGQYLSGLDLDDILANDPWDPSTNGSVAATTTINGVNTAPRFFIVHNVDLKDAAKSSLNMGPGYGALTAGSDITAFIVVGRGTGGTDNSQVVLISYYGKRF